MTQHAGLSEERWARFDRDQHILMIANEMHRTTRLLDDADAASRSRGYERVLRLADLTIALHPGSLRRELLRWRDLIAALYIADAGQPIAHRAALRVLLQLRPAAARQIPFLVR